MSKGSRPKLAASLEGSALPCLAGSNIAGLIRYLPLRTQAALPFHGNDLRIPPRSLVNKVRICLSRMRTIYFLPQSNPNHADDLSGIGGGPSISLLPVCLSDALTSIDLSFPGFFNALSSGRPSNAAKLPDLFSPGILDALSFARPIGCHVLRISPSPVPPTRRFLMAI